MTTCPCCKKAVQKLFSVNLYTEDLRREICAICAIQAMEPYSNLIYDPMMEQVGNFYEERILYGEIKEYLKRHPDEALETGQ